MGDKRAGELVFSKESKVKLVFLGSEEKMGWILYKLQSISGRTPESTDLSPADYAFKISSFVKIDIGDIYFTSAMRNQSAL